MKVNLDINSDYKGIELTIKASQITDEITNLMKRISSTEKSTIVGYLDDEVYLLDDKEIIRIYANDKKVIAETSNYEFILRTRLYEIEDKLDLARFVRISNSEIINLKSVKKLDLSFSGTIGIVLANNKTSYVSRRYVGKIKETLGI